MANTIKLRQSSTASSVPTAGQLQVGELAYNSADHKLWIKDNAGTVQELPTSVVDTLGALTDVDLTGAADNDLLFRSGGDWIDTNGRLTWSGSALRVYDSGGTNFIQTTHNGTNAIISTSASGNIVFQTSAAETMLEAKPNGGVDLYYNNIKRLSTDTGTAEEVQLFSDTSPGLGAIQDINISFRQADGTALGNVGFDSTTQLEIVNRNHGAGILIQAEDAVGVEVNILNADPDATTQLLGDTVCELFAAGTRLVRATSLVDSGTVDLYQGSNQRFSTASGSKCVLRSDGFTSGSDTAELWFSALAGAEWGSVGFYAGTVELTNNVNSGGVNLVGSDSAGADTNLLTGDPDGAVTLYHDGAIKAETFGSGWQIRDDANAGAGGLHSVRFTMASSDGTNRARLGFAAQAALSLRNINLGGNVVIDAEDASGVVQTLFNGNPDGSVDLYHDGTKRVATGASGVAVLHGDGNTDTEFRILRFAYQNGTDRGYVGHDDSGRLTLFNGVHGAGCRIVADNASGTPTAIAEMDPDSGVILPIKDRNALVVGNSSATTGAIALGTSSFPDQGIWSKSTTAGDHVGFGAYINDGTRNERAFFGIHDNDVWGLSATGSVTVRPFVVEAAGELLIRGVFGGGVELYHNDVNTLETVDEDTQGTGARVLHADQSRYAVGMNVATPKANPSSWSATSTWIDYAGHVVAKFNTTAFTATTPASTDSDVPQGSMWTFVNTGASGNITIAAGSGVTLTWQDGNGGTTGNRTIGPGGAATLWRRNATNWYIWGTGIS